jgi:SAM-dependent methyltransferase
VGDVNFDQAYFDALYLRDPDPWDFRSSAYEKEKYEATLAALPRDRYGHALELGCSIGELTRPLASRADRVTAVDTSAVALEAARLACAGLNHVEFVQAHLPGGDWERPVDLVLLSEVLYYLDAQAVERVAARVMRCAPRADMVLVHWTGQTNYPLGGDEAVQCFLQHVHVADVRTFRAPKYRLDIVRAASVDLPSQG